ncbi:unnamed protein product [Closterium sp. NIES-53]
MILSISTISTPTALPPCPSHLSPWYPTPPPVAPLPPQSHAPSAQLRGVTRTLPTLWPLAAQRAWRPLCRFPPRPSSLPLQRVAVDFGAARGGDTGGADSGGAGSGGAECPTGTGGAGGAAVGGNAIGGTEGAGAGGTGVGGTGGPGAGDASAGGTGARCPGGGANRARAGGAGATGACGAGGTGAGDASAGGTAGRAGTAGACGPPELVPRGYVGATTQLQPSALTHLLSLPHAATEFPVAETREPASRASTPVHARRVARPRAPAVLGTHHMALPSCLAVLPRLASMLNCPEGDPDALDIPTPRTHTEVITGEYSSQWQTTMDAEMASWKSTGTYVNEAPLPGPNIFDGMWIFIVKRPPGSPRAFKARYVARGFSQRQGVDFF